MEEASDGIMQGRSFVEIAIASEPDSAVEILKSIEGIKEIRHNERILIVEHDPQITSADIIEICVKQNIRIDELKRGAANLEEIFMHMTGNDE